MPWKRRQPTWPFLVALGCLFVLTLAAPTWWHRHRAHAPGVWNAPAMRVERESSDAWRYPTAPRQPVAPPTLPPLVGGEPRPQLDYPTPGPAPLAAPSLAGPVVESNDYDYVVVDEPLQQPAASETLGAGEIGAADLVAASIVPAPTAPALPAISPAVLANAREALLALVAQARQFETPTAVEPTTRVMVESSNDRLAMIPDTTSLVPTPAEPLASLDPTANGAAERPSVGPALRHRPVALLRELEQLQARPSAAPWATRVLGSLDKLANLPASEPAVSESLITELKSLSSSGFNEALSIANPADQSAWIRASRALDRRLPIWQLLVAESATRGTVERPAGADEGVLLESLHQVAALTAGTAEGAAWRTYLRLDDLAGLTSVGGDEYVDSRRAAARDVLLRMADPRLSAAQHAFLAQPALVALSHDLRPWAAGVVSVDALAGLVEDYELTGSQNDAESIAELRLRMKWSGDPQLMALADEMNSNYRNANLRIAVSTDLFNRLIPPQEPITAPLNDQIAGTEVHGRSRTETNARVVLMPDPTAWRFDLDVDGTVQSRTYSDVGPARVHNASRMEYELRKEIVLTRDGLTILPAEATVEGRNSLVGVDSGFDRVPIVGSLVEDVVRKKHRESQSAAMAQVKAKVRRQAQTRMDREADEKLRNLEARFAADVWAPLERFSLAAEPVDMSTTSERAVMRMRLAGEQHLGAHTPRPSAPSDSLASLQLHESAINNAIRGLQLDGKRMTVGELHQLLRTKFSARPEAPPADLPQRAIVEFAAHDAVSVACNGDCVALTLNIVELRKGRDSIRNVGVHAFFRPVIEGLEVKLVRDGTLQFEGSHLRTGPRLVLHSVFGKLLRKDQEVPVLAARLGDDPRLAGLMVTQLVIDDGWVALSVGPTTPERTAWRTRVPAALTR